ncbi:MAG: ribosomal-processing cysteine protease Prp [Lachnospiraceae bacterium]|nr:ribosomal-processing cysteine protease Prp [Lachnospiraceae bacterium]
MIRVCFKYDADNTPVAFKCEGHAGFARKGKDIVCAALSILTINTVNSIESLTDDAFILDQNPENGYMYFRFGDDVVPGRDSLLLLKSFELGVRQLSAENKAFISITEWEV